jgi:hypothetical protein
LAARDGASAGGWESAGGAWGVVCVPRTVPGADSEGLVAPRMTRPAATTPLPSQTMGTTGPEVMYLRRLGKKGLDTKSL